MSTVRRSLLVLLGVVPMGCALAFDFDGFTGAPADASAEATLYTPPDRTVAGTENCTNGVDDDGDGLADCVDPKCGAIGYACRAVPEGWKGPYGVAAGEAPAPCAVPYAEMLFEAKDDLRAPLDPSCDCECGPLVNEACSGVLRIESTCGTGTSYGLTRDCREIPNPPGTQPWKANLGGRAGQCTPIPSPPTPAKWGKTFRTCGVAAELPAGGCTGPDRCAPPTPEGFGVAHCIVHEGEVACPAGYPNKQAAWLGLADGRTCLCTCEPPGCPTNVTVYQAAGCAAGGVNIPASCTGVVSGIRSARLDGATRCTPSGGLPYGTASPASPVTICCGR